MKFKEALGIDVSKKTIDVILHLNSNYHQFANNVKGYKAMLLADGHLFTFFNPLVLRHRLRVAAMAEQGITES